jgi:phosphate acyltransferase
MTAPVRIALDAMGTDHAPRSEVAGVLEALSELPEIEVTLVGPRDIIEAEFAHHGGVPERVAIHEAADRVTAADAPASVLRRKPDSSLVVGLKLQREGTVDAFVSAGSTGAIMATSLFTLKRLPGVDRPTVGTIIPTVREPCLLLDAGANVDSKPQHLVQFAHLGSIYAQDMMGRSGPRVALLNIGEEPGKGDELTAAAYGLLADQAGLNFIGNIEGRDIIGGICDVVVCDGFVGNVLLKFYESVASFIVELLKKTVGDAANGSRELNEALRVLDYAEIGGAQLLGVGGVSVICHGESTPKAIRNAIKVAARAVRTHMVEHSARELSNLSEEAS